MQNSMLYLVSSQDPEGRYNLFGCIRICCLSGHEVNEGLEGHQPSGIGVDQHHDPSKLHLTLSQGT